MTLGRGDRSAAPYFWANAWALAVIAITTLHHVYGAIAFDTPWRLHIVFIAVPIGALITVGLVYAWPRRHSRAGQLAKWSAALLSLVFAFALIGLYEGGYNHVLANIVFQMHGPEALMAFYDADIHQLPTEPVFEATGVAQFAAGLGAGWTAIQLLRSRPDALGSA